MLWHGRRSRALALGATTLVVGALVGTGLAQQAQQSKRDAATKQATNPAPTRLLSPVIIGTVDFNVVLSEYQKFKFLMGELKEKAMEKEAELARIEQQGRAAAEKMAKFERDSQEYRKYDADVNKLGIEFEAAKTQAGKDLDLRQRQILIQVNSEIQQITAYVAKQHDMTMVIKKTRPSSPSDDAVMRDLAAKSMMAQAVVYADSKYDITSEVVEWLNKQYAVSLKERDARSAAAKSAPPTTKTSAATSGAPGRTNR